MPDVTWWGHATCTIDDRGVRVLTDPLFCSRLGHLRRRRGPLPDDRSRRADLAVVSHLHADHLHLGSLSVLPRHVPVAVPSGALRALPGLRRLRDRELIEVAPGDTVRVGDVVVEVVPADHDGHRWPWSRRRAPALGYVVSGTARTYFAGDTDWSAVVREAVGRCDIALLPVLGWGPRWDPDTSTRCAPPASWPSSTPTTPFPCTSARCGRSASDRSAGTGSTAPERSSPRTPPGCVSPARCGSCSPGRRRGSMCPIARRGDGEPGSGRPGQ